MAVMRGHAEKWLGRGGMAAIVVTLLLAGNWRPVHALPRQQDQTKSDSEALTTTEKDQVGSGGDGLQLESGAGARRAADPSCRRDCFHCNSKM